MSDSPVAYAFGFVDTGTSIYWPTVEAIMNNDPLQTKPLDKTHLGHCEMMGWVITLTDNGGGLIITAPDGKVINLLSPQFGVSRDGKRLEVRVK